MNKTDEICIFQNSSGKYPPPQNDCQLKSSFFLKKKTPVSHPPLSQFKPDFSQNQSAVITLNTGSPRTLGNALQPSPKP